MADVATRATLMDLLAGVAAHLGVADVVGDDPIGVDELAARHAAMFWAGDAYRSGAGMLDAVRTGEPVAGQVFGMPFFDHLAQDPEASATFNGAMGGGAPARAAAALEHAWADRATVADIGGGDGSLLRTLLAAHPHLRGVVFDLPHVVAEAERATAAAGLADRLAATGGDFLADPLPAADVHILAQILHDWDDERAVERSEDEWTALLSAGGFRLASITPAAGTCLIEAVPDP